MRSGRELHAGRGLAVLGALGLACLGWGCEGGLEAAQETVVSRHRAEAQGRSGVLRGLEVLDGAVGVSERVDRAGRLGCAAAAPLAGGVRVELKARLERPDGGLEAQLSEVRELLPGPDGALLVRWTARFEDVTGRSGDQVREERVVGGAVYVQEAGLPFIRRRARPSSRASLQDRGLDGVGSVLAAGGSGWYSAGQEGGWQAAPGVDGLRLGCAPSGEARGWLHRLWTLGELESASARLGDAGTRRAELVLRLEDQGGFRIHILVEEFKVLEQAPVEAPSSWVVAGRDRPLRDAQEILGARLGLEAWRQR